VPLLPLLKGAYVKLSVKREANDAVLMKNREDVSVEEEPPPPMIRIRNIVEQHGGQIVVYRESEKSMNCHIFLPTMVDRSPSKDAQPPRLPRGTERILLVDDEKEVMETFKQMLTYLGYSVFSTTSGVEALDVFHKAPDQFDLLITDQTMPKMTGIQLTSEVKRIRPSLPVILCSGFGDVFHSEETRRVGVQDLIVKPLTASEIAQKVRQVLERG
jgi:CheY-like chemotaxis protein